MYLPGCPPRPEMLIDAILKLHAKIMDEPLGPKRAAELAGPGRPSWSRRRSGSRRTASGTSASRHLGAPTSSGRSRRAARSSPMSDENAPGTQQGERRAHRRRAVVGSAQRPGPGRAGRRRRHSRPGGRAEQAADPLGSDTSPEGGTRQAADRRRAHRHVRRRTAPATPPASAAWSASPATPRRRPSGPTAATSTRSPTRWCAAMAERGRSRRGAAADHRATAARSPSTSPATTCIDAALGAARRRVAAVRAVLVDVRCRLRRGRRRAGCTSSTT